MLSVYAVPTMRGWVCYAVSGDVGAGCVSTLTDGISIALSRGRDPSAVAARGFEGALRTLVFGLASDDVRAVTLVDDAGTEYAPEMGENAYLMELPPDVNLVEVRIQYNDAPPSTVRLSP
jgi:hypothetical protein